MREAPTKRFVALITILLFLVVTAMPGWNRVSIVHAQDGAPADITETPTEPPPPTATDTATPTPTDTSTPTPTNTVVVQQPTDTPTVTPTNTAVTSTPVIEPPTPVTVPEPVTVVLFGTGLAALSAAVAARRKQNKE